MQECMAWLYKHRLLATGIITEGVSIALCCRRAANLGDMPSSSSSSSSSPSASASFSSAAYAIDPGHQSSTPEHLSSSDLSSWVPFLQRLQWTLFAASELIGVLGGVEMMARDLEIPTLDRVVTWPCMQFVALVLRVYAAVRAAAVWAYPVVCRWAVGVRDAVVRVFGPLWRRMHVVLALCASFLWRRLLHPFLSTYWKLPVSGGALAGVCGNCVLLLQNVLSCSLVVCRMCALATECVL